MSTQHNWITVCRDTDLVANSGVCALFNDQQIALFKQRYCLESGQCLDDDAIKLIVYPVRIEQNHVQLQWVD